MHDLSLAHCQLIDPVLPDGWNWQSPATVTSPCEDTRLDPPGSETHHTAHQDSTLVMVSTRLAHMIAESLDGRRPLNQLEAWFDPESVTILLARHLFQPRVRVASVRVQAVTTTTAEVSVRLTTPERDHAAAMRVTCVDQRCYGTGLVMG